MKIELARRLALLTLAAALTAVACHGVDRDADDGDDDDSGGDTDTDTDGDGDADADADTDTQYTGPAIPETCEHAEVATTTVGCQFYAVDLDSHDSVETQQYAVAVSNVNQTDTATVRVYQASASGWNELDAVTVAPMSLHIFNLPDFHMNSSGIMVDGSYKVESDVPIIAYQFNPVDGASSYLSDASMLIPTPSLAQTYEIMGWKQTTGDGDMRAYFTVVAITDGTEVTVWPSVSPLPGDAVPSGTSPFTVVLNDGDVLEVQTENTGDSLAGSRVESNDDHPIAVFSGQECAFIPENVYACDHLEEQMPGLKFWGKEFVAARMPVRSTAFETEMVLWQIYAFEDNTSVSITANDGVIGLPFESATIDSWQVVEFYVTGQQDSPGDFFVEADKPIGIMQYMVGSENPNCSSIGDPAMVSTSPTEQFLPRYVVLVPSTWINDALIITRHAGVGVLLDGVPIPDSEFLPVANSGYEVARHATPDGVHTLVSEDESYGLAVVVVGWDEWDSYAYAGGMGMGVINPEVE